MITISLVTICRLTKNIVIDYIPHTERFTPTTLLFVTGSLYLLIFLTYFFLHITLIQQYLINIYCVFGMKESEVPQLYLTLCDPMDCSPPGSSIHDIF